MLINAVIKMTRLTEAAAPALQSDIKGASYVIWCKQYATHKVCGRYFKQAAGWELRGSSGAQ